MSLVKDAEEQEAQRKQSFMFGSGKVKGSLAEVPKFFSEIRDAENERE